jgi:hypothetical protein
MKFVGIFPQTVGWYLLGMRYMRMRKISGCMTSCYNPSWVHSHRPLPHCTLFGIIDVFSHHAVAEQSDSPISRSPVALPIASSPPHGARHTYRPTGIVSWYVIYTTVCVVKCETHKISDVCELTAVLPGPETQKFENHLRIKMIVENVTSDLFMVSWNWTKIAFTHCSFRS